MKKTIETILNTPLLKNSLIVFIGSFGVNVLNYLYNLVMVRLLPKEDFGELISIVSLLTIINIFAGGINLIVTRFTASIHVKHSQSAVKAFMNNFIRLIFPFSIVISIFFILSIPQLGTYLGLNDTLPLWILSIFIFFSFFAPIPLSVIQGLHRFRAFSFLTFFAGCTKFIFSILFIFTIPFISRVSSAILGIVLSGVCVFFLSFFFIRDIRIKQPATSTKIEWKALLTYAIPAFIAFSGITLLANIDIILANAMLSDPLSSANYAGLSTLGKIIFYATGVIPMVLYPLVSTKHSKEESSHRLFFSSIIIIFLAGGCAFFVYQTFPELIISLLLGADYLEIIPYLGLFALMMTFYSTITVCMNYYLSVHKYGILILPIIGSASLFGMLHLQDSISFESFIYTVFYNMIGIFICMSIWSLFNERTHIARYIVRINQLRKRYSSI